LPGFLLSVDHSACGVALVVNLPSPGSKQSQHNSHQLVQDGLKRLADFEYRSGTNQVTGESDGAGLRFYGLNPAFFQKKNTGLGGIKLVEGEFGVGHYFLSPSKETEAKALIESTLKQKGLNGICWRDLNSDDSIDNSALSAAALLKKPALWQVIILEDTKSTTTDAFEKKILAAGIALVHAAREHNTPVNIVSQSAESIVYKGMVLPDAMGAFYKDLNDPDFTAHAVTLHARFATNTSPQWVNAQPCPFFWSHNGELNSAQANATEMQEELTAQNFEGVYPNSDLSDSMQFDADLANMVVMYGISLEEAFVRLMSPVPSNSTTDETHAMLKWFKLSRTPYNGPAFGVAAFNGHFIAKLDGFGLRPSRFSILEDQLGNRQFHAASDDYIFPDHHWRVVQKGELEPGGMIMITPAGEILRTNAILERIAGQHAPDHFQRLYAETVHPLSGCPDEPLPPPPLNLIRTLIAAGWDHEGQEALRFMAEHGAEKVGAMGDDTNPLHTTGMPPHLSYFFHQLFAQVSAPPLDSIKERARFTLKTTLGPRAGVIPKTKQIELRSPLLGLYELHELEKNSHVQAHVLDTTYEPSEANHGNSLRIAINLFLEHVQTKMSASPNGCILILSDRKMTANRMLIPDMIAVAAVRNHLKKIKQSRLVSIVSDSYQMNGPHQAAAVLSVGANAVYARGAYEMLTEDPSLTADKRKLATDNYRKALENGLLKTMGKMGITDVNNYCNGRFIASLGLDLSSQSNTISPLENEINLANLFEGIYAPMRGIKLDHVAIAAATRHAYAFAPENDHVTLPRAGHFMPEKAGIKHGYGLDVVNAFTTWLNAETHRATLFRIHCILKRQSISDYINEAHFDSAHGFLHSEEKEKDGTYPDLYLEAFRTSSHFKALMVTVDAYSKANPTALRDYLSIKPIASHTAPLAVQPQKEIRACLYSGSMSQGALTVSAHEMLTRGMNAIGAMSASGEGGEAPEALRDRLHSTRSKQIASGRFGVSAMQILYADEIEIKMAQGAKPGEGGELPGAKVSIRFAAQRGCLPGIPLTSPPPHHDIYSIEDLAQLIFEIKSIHPTVKVCVKLVSSAGIGTIAAGVAKAGADVINIAGNSGGTGAAQQSSIQHAGLPAEIGLTQVVKALHEIGYRDLVTLRVSGGFKTASDVIKAAILGADLFEFGTTAMLTMGCKMQRTCNHSCKPGIATDGHLFKGDQANVERYFVNMAAEIQNQLRELGVCSLAELKGRTDLLILDPEIANQYDFSSILERSDLAMRPKPEALTAAKEKRAVSLRREKEDALVLTITAFFKGNPSGTFITDEPIKLTTQDRAFGARLAGAFAPHLETYPDAKIVLHTTGCAGQGFACFMPKGMSLIHTGPGNDGCGKSMSGSVLVIKTSNPAKTYKTNEQSIAGNAMLYGASGGKIVVNGVAGHRCGILMKGAQVVVEGVGDYAFEYMTDGTAMVLGRAGDGLCTGARGGIVFAYNPTDSLQYAADVRAATPEEHADYASSMRDMLVESSQYSEAAKEILDHLDLKKFSVLIPKSLDDVQTLRRVLDVIETYKMRVVPISIGMQVWLEKKLQTCVLDKPLKADLEALRHLLSDMRNNHPLSKEVQDKVSQTVSTALQALAPPTADMEDLYLVEKTRSIKKKRPTQERIASPTGVTDYAIQPALQSISDYMCQLTADATGCSGCRAQSCAGAGDDVKTGCPSGKSINTINGFIKQIGPIGAELTQRQWRLLRQAFAVQTEASPFINYTGAACPAPCQDACTESIPTHGTTLPKRAEPVHIKDIEWALDQLGRALGWFDGQVTYSANNYNLAMQGFKPLFRKADRQRPGKKLVIVGSGPAAMQMAYEALRDGIETHMYEKSDQPGGLLRDGIPHHKFDKSIIHEDFEHLKRMGLTLHLKSEVIYEEKSAVFKVGETCIAIGNDEHTQVALCVGNGDANGLPPQVTKDLPNEGFQKIIQGIDFLRTANDIADALKKNPSWTALEIDKHISQKLGRMDPRGKKVIVIGGGDTAQDVLRWLVRFKTDTADFGQLLSLVRGSKPMGTPNTYPYSSGGWTDENILRDEELCHIAGETAYSEAPIEITHTDIGQLRVKTQKVAYQSYDEIQLNPEAIKLWETLPPALRPTASMKSFHTHDADMVICALGFQKGATIDLVRKTREANLSNVSVAGDASDVQAKIIVGAQANASDTWRNRIASNFNVTPHDSVASNMFSHFASRKEPMGAAQHPGSVFTPEVEKTVDFGM
jgi:glutamate synthase domain-containing protein 2/glutamate synthase domain-containing protein 3/glutamate synthase domain-containing protein 1/NADPH-dependent glutamate synthase beta subunit-like oxidoreductase